MTLIDGVILGHTSSLIASFSFGTTINGKEHKLRGTRSSILKIDTPVVILLSPESTVKNGVVSPSAEEEFVKAVKKLSDESVEFYTVLRPEWNLPALYWRKVV